MVEHTCMRTYYSAKSKEPILIHTTWKVSRAPCRMKSQLQKVTWCLLLFIWHFLVTNYKDREQITSWQKLRMMGRRGGCDHRNRGMRDTPMVMQCWIRMSTRDRWNKDYTGTAPMPNPVVTVQQSQDGTTIEPCTFGGNSVSDWMEHTQDLSVRPLQLPEKNL